MSELIRLIDEWRRTHGMPSEASVSRAISPTEDDQLVGAWRRRGLKEMPKEVTLQKLARYLGVDLEAVVLAAARDVFLKPPPEGRAESGDGSAAEVS